MWTRDTEPERAPIAPLLVLLGAVGSLACAPHREVLMTVGPETVTVSMARTHFGEEGLPICEGGYLRLAARERGVLASSDMQREEAVSKRLEDLREEVLVEAYLLLRHPGLLDISRERLFHYYRDSKERRHVAHILCPDEREAEKVAAQVQGGLPFEEAARRWSKDEGSREKGGDLGWIRRGQTDPSFESAAFTMKAGELSSPVESPFGFHILRLLEVKVPSRADFLQDESTVREAWRRERLEAARNLETARLRGRVKVTKNTAALQGDSADLVERPGDEKTVVAVVGTTKPLTVADLKAFMRRTFPSGRASHTLGPSTKEQFLDILISRWILLAAARDAGTEKSETFRCLYWDRSHALLSSLVEDAAVAAWKVPEGELEAYCRDHTPEVARSPRRRLAILVGNDFEGLRELGQSLRARPEAFEEAVRRFSVDSETAEAGGDIGWADDETLAKLLPPESALPVLHARKGEVLGPFRTPLGILLVQVTEEAEGPPKPFEAVKGACEEAYRRRFRDKILAEWQKELEGRFPVRFFLDRVR